MRSFRFVDFFYDGVVRDSEEYIMVLDHYILGYDNNRGWKR